MSDVQRTNASESNDSDSNQDVNNNPVASSSSNIWEVECEFANQREMDEFLKVENQWSLFKTEHLVKGTKMTFRCNKVKRRGDQCASGIYTLMNPNDGRIKLYRKLADHDCDQSNNKVKSKVDDTVRQFILDQYKLGNPPATILFKLRKMSDITQPTKEQVTHIIQYNKEKMPNPTISIADMEAFYNEHKAIPDDDDAPFVVNFECSAPQTSNEQKFFRIFYSTKRLLKYANESENLHADGTYKITVQGYPALVIGISDADKHFHLSGLALVSSESSDDYKFLFDSVRRGVKLATNQELKATKLIADMAPAITQGFELSGDGHPYTRVHCFMHLMANVEKQKFNQAANKEAIKCDIRSLQLVNSKRLFDIGCKLLIQKWKKAESSFIEYFENVYIKTNANWFEGAADKTPKTNNCLEVFNRLLKQQQLQNVRKPLNQFLPFGLEIVRERSMAYIQDKLPPTTTVTITDEMKLKGWDYSKSKKSFFYQKSQDGASLYYVFAGDNMDKVQVGDVRKWQNSTYKGFDDFVDKTSSMYEIEFNDLAQVSGAKCTCVSYVKNNMCKHILGVAYRNGTLDPPDDLLKTVETPAPVKNKRGRPRKTKKALIVD